MEENRRRDYRHYFNPHERIRVELNATKPQVSLAGAIVNLSIGGMMVQLDDPTLTLKTDDQFRANFTIPPNDRHLTFQTVVNRVQDWDGIICHSFRYFPLIDPKENESRERALWLFLLDEQRRRGRILRHTEHQ